MIILLILVLNTAYANEYIQACFTSSKVATRAERDSAFVLTKSDSSRVQGKCIDYNISSSRKKILLKYLRTNYRGNYRLSSEEGSYRECNLSLIKESYVKGQSNNTRLNKQINLNQNNSRSKNRSSQSIKVRSGSLATIKMGLNELALRCSVTDRGYNIRLETKDRSQRLETSFFLGFGQTKNLGGFNEKLNDNDNSIDLKGGISNQKTKQISQTTYLLSAGNN